MYSESSVHLLGRKFHSLDPKLPLLVLLPSAILSKMNVTREKLSSFSQMRLDFCSCSGLTFSSEISFLSIWLKLCRLETSFFHFGCLLCPGVFSLWGLPFFGGVLSFSFFFFWPIACGGRCVQSESVWCVCDMDRTFTGAVSLVGHHKPKNKIENIYFQQETNENNHKKRISSMGLLEWIYHPPWRVKRPSPSLKQWSSRRII